MFKELDNGFILKQLQYGAIVAMYVEENGNIRELSLEDKDIAQGMGLSVIKKHNAKKGSH